MPKRPDEDSFYEAPLGFENEELGTIFKSRKEPHKIRALHVNR